MSTSATVHTLPSTLPGRRYDRVFFSFMVILLVATVLLGFSRTYFLIGMVLAPLPALIIHIHAVVFSTWMILLLVQTALVSARRVDLHRKLGIFGFFIGCLMPIVGLLAAINALGRGSHPLGLDAKAFFVVPVSDIILFTILIAFAYRARRTDIAAHKRLIIIATIALADAAVARWPFAYLQNPPMIGLTLFCFLFLVVGYDLWSTHKIQRATLWGSLSIILVTELRVPFAFTPLWRHIADFALKLS